MSDLTIYIPTKGRLKQKTWSMLQKAELPHQIYLVCETADAERLQSQTASLPGVQCVAFNEQGIHRVRQFILDHCPTDYVLMLDDDMSSSGPRALRTGT